MVERNYETRIEGDAPRPYRVLRVKRGQQLLGANGTVYSGGQIVPEDEPALAGNRGRVYVDSVTPRTDASAPMPLPEIVSLGDDDEPDDDVIEGVLYLDDDTDD